MSQEEGSTEPSTRDPPPPPSTTAAAASTSSEALADGVDLSELMLTLPPAISTLRKERSSSDAGPTNVDPPNLRSFTSEDRKRIQFAEHTLTESQKTSSSSASSSHQQGGGGGSGGTTSSSAAVGGGGGGSGGSPQQQQQQQQAAPPIGPNASTSIPSLANANRRPVSTRRKKSIRITLDDERLDAKSDAGSISSMIERNKLRFEDSPTTPVTPMGSKGSIASNDTSLFDDKLRLLSISDASTGMCLFKCTWNWRRNTNVDGVGSLVQSFYQFAREIGDGGLAYISFELAGSRSHHKHTPRKRQQSLRSQASMSVLTCKDPTCVVALFFDDRQLKPTDPETERLLRAYLEAVKQDFVASFKSKVEALRPTLKDIADGKNQTIEVTDLQKSFECFEPVVLALREKMLPDNLIGQPNSTT